MNEEIWYGVTTFLGIRIYQIHQFFDIDIGIKEMIIKTHLSITIMLLRQLSKPNCYVTFFWDTVMVCLDLKMLKHSSAEASHTLGAGEGLSLHPSTLLVYMSLTSCCVIDNPFLCTTSFLLSMWYVPRDTPPRQAETTASPCPGLPL